MIDENGNFVATPQQTVVAPPPPTAATVYSAPNITQAVTQPTPAPNLSDPMGIYDYYVGGQDVTSARDAATAASKARVDASNTARNRQLAIEQNPLESMQYIVGAQSRAGQLDAVQLQALAESEGVAQSAYQAKLFDAKEKANIAISKRNELTQLILQNPGAKISYSDTPETAAKKIEKYGKEQEKKAYKDNLKQTALQLGIKTKGSTKEIESRLKKYYGSKAEYERQIQSLDLAAKRKALSGGGSAAAGASNELKAVADAYTKFGGNWGQTANYLADKGYNISEGSVIDNELRRRNGLAPITTKTAEQTQTDQKAQQTAQNALSIVERLKSSGGALGNAVGPISSKLPTVRGGSADFEQNYNALKSLLTLENMGIMKGVLSDSDMKIIQNASANLSLGQSESGFKSELERIQTILQNRLGGRNNNDPLGLGF